MTAPDVRPLTQADLDWAVGLTRVRRDRLEGHAPRFWRAAADATERHRAFLSHLIDDAATLSVRSDHGYLVAMNPGPYLLVDDMVVEPAEQWASEGVALLRHASAFGPLRFVVPGFESERLDAALDLGLEPAEIWWHRDLEPFTGLNVVSEDKSISVEGAAGQLVPAPPVYDPGGPVLLVTSVTSPDALTRVEQSAARRGARVSVVTQPPSDAALATLLDHAGYTLTTFFFTTPTSA
ncbi:hypothetical protein NPS01_18300 [Nocardioides psychrotolerans]|uniref:Uncharacterized protein n=1 Tax=Nocardioides psychrotolerans TaxID=1005945 RepID=A0A1I3JFL4_9ACTN|nr:hypothetical protein [Nocardioides psychrotolerans]GEP38167.1 hypothetical protein NPS01_18300 [Nocardioides psychrotolerans]SFI59072.1 hypothetical protein SAMN05216561_110119 [Nocardioides psychrotolerans]